MQKEDIILFGASKLGEIAYTLLKDQYNILYYCDNDKTKAGKFINGIKIIGTEDLKNIDDNIKFVISSTYYREISKQLISMGKNNLEIFSVNINSYTENTRDNVLSTREVNLGNFLKSIDGKVNLDNVTFISGGSGILDYVFLKAIAIKFEISSYLEIGSFIGESMDAISNIVKECYSISLPDIALEEYFNNKGMSNFSSYFMNGNKNIIQYKGDSKKFDFNLINKNIQLVFIDGDHSYGGVYADTKNIFNFINTDESIVVWHDFKINSEYRLPVINAVFNALPEELHSNIYSVDNNLCGIYIPNKYLNSFEFTKDRNTLFSYEVNIKIKDNKLM